MNSFLDARDARQAALTRALCAGGASIVSLSLNIPGADKTPPGASALFSRTFDAARAAWPDAVVHHDALDALGRFVVLAIDDAPFVAKRTAVAIESATPAARLVDIDVYSPDGAQTGRRALGFPARPCLVCTQAAVDCIRQQRHPQSEVLARVHALLATTGA